jgi:hypothetical protein
MTITDRELASLEKIANLRGAIGKLREQLSIAQNENAKLHATIRDALDHAHAGTTLHAILNSVTPCE